MNMEQPSVATPTTTKPANWKIMMAESGLGMFFLRFALLLVNLFTLFLAYPWTCAAYYSAWARNVEIDGRRIRFTGNAGSFFIVWLKTLLLSTITLGLYWIFIGKKNTARWVDSNLSWA